jgi:hypothetical protein
MRSEVQATDAQPENEQPDEAAFLPPSTFSSEADTGPGEANPSNQ